MKRRKILVLIPMLGLFLSGCTFQEGFATAKSWIGEHIYHPVKDWIEDITGKKDEPTPEPKPTPEPGPGPGPGPSPVVVDYGTAEQPLSLAEFQTNVEKVIDYSSVEEGKTVTHTEAPFYIKAQVKSNEAINNGQIRFTNLIDGTVEVTGFYLSFDEGVDSAKYGVANAMLGSEIVVKGYGMIFKKMVNEQPTKVFEIGNQSKDGEKGKILSVTPPEPTPGTNYGTAEAPLTTSQAWALLDGENPSKSAMFVTGTVKSNTVWSTEHSNVDIVITDGAKDFTIFRANKFPANFAKEAITADSLVGATVVATGTGKIYTKNNVSTYELDQGCEVLSLEFPTPTVTSVTLNTYEMALEVGKPDGQLTATVVGEHDPAQTVTWESSNPEVATVANGVVHAVAKGTTNIKAISTVDTTKESQPCVVTVTEPEVIPVLESISVTGPTKTTYEEGETLDLTGLVVTAHYTNAPDAEVTTGWTSVPAAGATLTTSDTSLVVSYQGHDAAAVTLTVNEEVFDSLADVCAAGVAAGTGESTKSYKYKGVVTGVQGNSFYIQNGEYGMYIYNYASLKPEVGDVVKVVSTVTSFNSSPQSKTVSSAVVLEEEMAAPTPISITGISDIGNVHVLASVPSATFVSRDKAWASNAASLVTFTVGTDTIKVKFDKYGYDETKAGIINAAVAGDEFVLTNVITAVNNTDKQLGFSGSSSIQKVVKVIASIGTVTGPTEAVALNYEFKNTDVTVQVNYEGGGSGTGKVTAINAATNVSGTNLHGTVTIEGWADPIDFTYSVADAPAQDVIYNKVTSSQTDWSGTYVMVCENTNADYIYDRSITTDNNQTTAVTITNNQIKNPTSTQVITIAAYDGGYSIRLSDNKYLSGTGKAENKTAYSDTEAKLLISYSSTDGFEIKTTADNVQYLRANYNNGTPLFRFYKEASKSTGAPVCLYKLSA